MWQFILLPGTWNWSNSASLIHFFFFLLENQKKKCTVRLNLSWFNLRWKPINHDWQHVYCPKRWMKRIFKFKKYPLVVLFRHTKNKEIFQANLIHILADKHPSKQKHLFHCRSPITLEYILVIYLDVCLRVEGYELLPRHCCNPQSNYFEDLLAVNGQLHYMMLHYVSQSLDNCTLISVIFV